jgi:hypothetical protein
MHRIAERLVEALPKGGRAERAAMSSEVRSSLPTVSPIRLAIRSISFGIAPFGITRTGPM